MCVYSLLRRERMRGTSYANLHAFMLEEEGSVFVCLTVGMEQDEYVGIYQGRLRFYAFPSELM